MNRILLLLAAPVFWLGAISNASASFHETVLSVGSNTITIKMSDRGPRAAGVTFNVPAGAVISVDNLPSKLSDVQAGMVVTVSMGLDADSVDEITAHTVPPARKAAKLGTTRALGVGLTSAVVIAISDSRITYGVPGTEAATAALITPITRVTMNNAPISPTAIETGMPVEVETDGSHARLIRIIGQDKN